MSAAGPVVTLIEFDSTGVSAPEEKISVREPTTPEIARSVNVAVDPPLVPTVTSPWRAPAPSPIATVMFRSPATGLPVPSTTCTTGCCPKGTPLCALVEGCCVSTSRVAPPAVTTMGPVLTGVSGLPWKLVVNVRT